MIFKISQLLTWTVLCLSKKGEFKKKLLEEIENISEDVEDKLLFWSDFSNLKKLKYMKCVLNESLRLFPPVFFFFFFLIE